MGRERRVEIAGAGLVGLTAAALLARHGWTVRVHERSPEVREVGAGLFLWSNALGALREAGAEAAVLAKAERLKSWERFDEQGRRIFHREIGANQSEGPVIVSRRILHSALLRAAEAAGVEILTSSEVIGASNSGTLNMRAGADAPAELVIGADGVHSTVRKALGLERQLARLGSGGMRHLLTRVDTDIAGAAIEYKAGARSLGVISCGEWLYVYLECRTDDLVGRRGIAERRSWSSTFPGSKHVLDRVHGAGVWAEFLRLRCTSWSAERAVLLGDAAHAMSPHLSQGACLGMANAQSLAHALDRVEDVTVALRAWEATERPITDLTQQWATRFALVGSRWPSRLLPVRSALLQTADRSSWVRSQTGRAAAHRSRWVSSEA